MHINKIVPLALLLVLCFSQCKKSKTNVPDPVPGPTTVTVKDSVIVTGLHFPWEILWGPDNFIWMTERGGKISRVNPATGAVTLLHTITEVVSTGEGGLLGMVLHPNFSSNPHVFVAYNYNSGGYKEKIVRFTYTGTSLTSPVTILDNITASSIHNGCRLVITPDLKLFISTDDEINIIEKGRNYGWPNVPGFCNGSTETAFCTANNVREPLMAWTPTTAVCGMDYYPSDAIPQWKHSLLVTALKDSRLYQLKLDAARTAITSTTEHYVSKYGRMRDVCISPAGRVYICTSNGNNADRIIELKAAP